MFPWFKVNGSHDAHHIRSRFHWSSSAHEWLLVPLLPSIPRCIVSFVLSSFPPHGNSSRYSYSILCHCPKSWDHYKVDATLWPRRLQEPLKSHQCKRIHLPLV